MESEMGSMKELLHGLSAQMASLVEKKKKKRMKRSHLLLNPAKIKEPWAKGRGQYTQN